jgi:hypothetical protein
MQRFCANRDRFKGQGGAMGFENERGRPWGGLFDSHFQHPAI